MKLISGLPASKLLLWNCDSPAILETIAGISYLSSLLTIIIGLLLQPVKNSLLKTVKQPVTIIFMPGFTCSIRLINCLALLSLSDVTVHVFIMDICGPLL
jgi:hypothetical protein